MNKLSKQRCEPCRAGAPKISAALIEQYQPIIPDWQITSSGGTEQLEREFAFEDFRQALEFTDRVGQIAEKEGHHPAILTEWGKVKVNWWTHKIGGLHLNDFVMAEKTDVLYQDFRSKE